MVCSKDSENINIKMDDNALKQVPKFKYLGSIIIEDGKNKEDIKQRIKEAKVMFNNKKQLLCSNNLSLVMEKKLIESCIWSVALCGSETWTLGKNKEGVINAFATWCWRILLQTKWTDRIMNDVVFERAKEERLLLKILKNRCHSWIGHTIRHKKFVVNILEGAIFGKKSVGRPQLRTSKSPETQVLTFIQQ